MTDLREKITRPATRKERIYLFLIFAVLAAIAAMLLLHPRTAADAAEGAAGSAGGAEEPRTVTRVVEIEKTVTVETIQDGLNDMGVLITQEYYFTDLMSFSSVKKFLKTDFTLPFTESSYLVRYDGVVSAGIDLSEARVEQDETRKEITVHLPKAAVQSVNIDLESFELLEEKTGLGNHLSVQDFNDSLLELERKAEQSAIARGLLEKADENAKTVVSRFIGGLVDPTACSLVFVTD